MVGVALVLAAALASAVQPAGNMLAEDLIVDFAPGSDADQLAREVCLVSGCQIRHIYRSVPGAAVSGGNRALLERVAGVAAVYSDLPVTFEDDAPALIGAPSHAPLAVVAGGLDTSAVSVERKWAYAVDTAAPSVTRAAATRLVRPLVDRLPNRTFWTLNVLDASGRGRLSDLLAALDQLVRLRFAVGAVFMPLVLEGQPPERLCLMTDEVLRKGLLVITAVDQGCPR